MLLSIETHITCDFPGWGGGVWTPYPLDLHMLDDLRGRGGSSQLSFETKFFHFYGEFSGKS